MRVYFISSDDHYAHRFQVLDDYLKQHGCETTFLTSDFSHMAKATYQCKVPGCVQIPARPYKKNLSVDRILSHRNFARDAFAYLEALPEQPDMLIVLLPPNFLGHYAAQYKRRHPDVKVILDIFDLWPETFPSPKAKKFLYLPFKVWAAIRDRSLTWADYVLTECDLFRNRLHLPQEKATTVYLSGKKPKCDTILPRIREDVLELCYLGSINNIISIEDICQLIRQLSAVKPVRLHIIGKGEKQALFREEATRAGADVVYYGPIYDDETKMRIMSACRFGLNIMKSSVCIGLTMKSVDYFRFGLPIINTIPADTQQLVENCGIGIQWGNDCAERILAMDADACCQMRLRVKAVFDEMFEEEQIKTRYAEVFTRFL